MVAVIFALASAAAAELGLIFCVAATVSGSLWAKAMWGSYWNWDPRETSIFFILLLYGAYLALRASIEEDEKRAISAITANLSLWAAGRFGVEKVYGEG